jgi:hypothetical protein
VVLPQDVRRFEELVGARTCWVYFSNNWFRSRRFPLDTCRWIRAEGKVPFIRLMLRSNDAEDEPDPAYAPERIAAGEFDGDLARWADAARGFGTPVLVEWGTEFNGRWFPWNGSWHGGGATTLTGDPERPDGPARFVGAFRHLVALMRSRGARNLRWVWHLNASDDPEEDWNRFERYYPGDDVVDWIGVSAYGLLTPLELEFQPLREQLDPVMERLDRLAPAKPVVLAEFGADERALFTSAERWGREALTDVLSGRWGRVIGFCWWNEAWRSDENSSHDTDMIVEDDPALTSAFRGLLRTHDALLQPAPVVRLMAPSPSTADLYPPPVPEGDGSLLLLAVLELRRAVLDQALTPRTEAAPSGPAAGADQGPGSNAVPPVSPPEPYTLEEVRLLLRQESTRRPLPYALAGDTTSSGR